MLKEYEEYLKEHISNVVKCGELMGIKIEHHDDSKYMTEEIDGYERRFFNKGEMTQEDEEAFQYAWLHHIHNNPHHWQHWCIPNEQPLRMPEKYVMEMVCDWGSFALKNQDPDELARFWYAKKIKYSFHSDTRKLVDKLVKELTEKLHKYYFQKDIIHDINDPRLVVGKHYYYGRSEEEVLNIARNHSIAPLKMVGTTQEGELIVLQQDWLSLKMPYVIEAKE